MRIQFISAVFAAFVLLTGCATSHQKYEWGNYDRSLYSYYKDPSNPAEHLEELQSIIEEAEKSKGNVAPGIYAEYGYFLMQQGKSTEAVAQFAKEKAKWPESAQFMDTMIKIASKQANKPLASKE